MARRRTVSPEQFNKDRLLCIGRLAESKSLGDVEAIIQEFNRANPFQDQRREFEIGFSFLFGGNNLFGHYEAELELVAELAARGILTDTKAAEWLVLQRLAAALRAFECGTWAEAVGARDYSKLSSIIPNFDEGKVI